MALIEQRRRQLDSIVQKMIQNNESDENIQFVVDDFKKKYEQEQQRGQEGIFSRITKTLAPKAIEQFGETLGEAAVAPLVGRQMKKEAGEDVELQRQVLQKLRDPKITDEQRKRLLKTQGFDDEDIEDILPSVKKSVGQIAGEAAGTLAIATVGAKTPATALGRIGLGAAGGALAGAGAKAAEGGAIGEVARAGAIGGAIGGALTGAVEAIGGAIRGIGQTQRMQRFAGNIYNKELRPPTKEVAQAIERGFKTFGEDAMQVTDDAGRAIYTGGYRKLLNVAKQDLDDVGKQLMDRADDFSDVAVRNKDIMQDVITQLDLDYGSLSDEQLNVIQREAKRIGQKLNVREMIEGKRLYDDLLPDSYWLNAGDQAKAFIGNVRYAFRDVLRKTINEATDDILKPLNERMSIAMDMRKLAAFQIAQRSVKRQPFTTWFGRIIDDYIFLPQITTRTAQMIRRSGAGVRGTTEKAAARAAQIGGVSAGSEL